MRSTAELLDHHLKCFCPKAAIDRRGIPIHRLDIGNSKQFVIRVAAKFFHWKEVNPIRVHQHQP